MSVEITDAPVMREHEISSISPSDFGSLSEHARKLLTRMKWHFEETIDGEKVQFRLIVNLDTVTSRTYIDCFEGSRQLGVFSYVPIKVAEEFREATLEYLTRVNHMLFSPKFEFDLRDGELRVTTSASLRDTSCTESLVRSMVELAHMTIDKHLPGVLMIIFGGLSAQDAWDKNAERRGS